LTFQNTQKITADIDALTGDPAFLENVKKLVNGLGQLVSSGETMEQQIKLAQELAPINRNISKATGELVKKDPALAAVFQDLELPVTPLLDKTTDFNWRAVEKQD
jgi:phospholipid/cholesterol/gamma-HCH transport system substrate-binding protein